MRTTLDIPDETFRRAKIAAVERGTTLRQLVGDALAKELGIISSSSENRVRFPIFSSKQSSAICPETVARVEQEEDEKQDALTR